MTRQQSLSSPGVRFPPPILFAAGLFAGWLIDRRWYPLRLSHIGGAWVGALGWVLIVTGLVTALWGAATFRLARTAIIPSNPASRLVCTGPYRFTRNPMYTGLTIAYLGVTALLDSAWPALLLPLVIAALVQVVIAREEAYLTHAFGDEYRTYQARVRRWL